MSAVVVPLTQSSASARSVELIAEGSPDETDYGAASNAVVLSFGLAKARRDHPSVRRERQNGTPVTFTGTLESVVDTLPS